jgi:hypothetical protein
MSKVKYVKTKDKQIIVFSEYFQHSDFKKFEPVSAGFIFFCIGNDGNPDCICQGESISLKLKSDPEDSELARRQVLGLSYW